jgi:GTP 3',8-cyclase
MTCTPHAVRQRAGRELIDGRGRRIDYLRLSLTDRCNLACRYCSAGGSSQNGHRLDADFAVALVRWLSVSHGISHVRLTGGEPLLHPELPDLVAGLADLGTLEEITLTTNGQMLANKAGVLRDAGLRRVNVSLDTLDPERFARVTRGGQLVRTLQGIEAALEVGLTPVRLNVVAQRGLNDDELYDLAEWGLSRGCTVRFLEIMPIGPVIGALEELIVPAAEILECLSERFLLRPVVAPAGQPATDYVADDLAAGGRSGVIGVIASTTRPFCSRCRRLRITARGEILSCLFDTGGSSLLGAWDGQSIHEATADRILQAAVMAKPAMGRRTRSTPMVAIGG